MKEKLFIAAAAVLLAAAAGSAFGQSLTSGPSISSVPPNFHLRGARINSSLLAFEARSTSRYTQMEALDQIDSLIVGKHVKLPPRERSAIEGALSGIALSGTGRPAISGRSVINDFPLLRVRACHAIGELGGPSAERILLRVLRVDRYPLVLSEAAYELGRLRHNPNDVVSNAIAAALRRTLPYQSEDQFAYSALLAFVQLAKAGKLKADPSVYLAVTTIGRMGLGYRVDQTANTTLQTLASYG